MYLYHHVRLSKLSSVCLFICQSSTYTFHYFFCRPLRYLLLKIVNNTEMFPLFSVEPIFDKVSPTKIEIIEDESRTVDMTARANPTDVTYTLYKQGEITQVSSFTINNGMLQISGIKRDHSGQYALKAANSEGFRFHNFSVNVLCK